MCPSMLGTSPMHQQPSLSYHLCCSFTAFVFPAAYHMWVYRTAKARAQCLKPPPRWIGGWTGAFLLNIVITVYFLVFGVGFGAWAAVTNLINNVQNLGLFSSCYQVGTLRLTNPGVLRCCLTNVSFACWSPMRGLLGAAVRCHRQEQQADLNGMRHCCAVATSWGSVRAGEGHHKSHQISLPQCGIRSAD